MTLYFYNITLFKNSQGKRTFEVDKNPVIALFIPPYVWYNKESRQGLFFICFSRQDNQLLAQLKSCEGVAPPSIPAIKNIKEELYVSRRFKKF